MWCFIDKILQQPDLTGALARYEHKGISIQCNQLGSFIARVNGDLDWLDEANAMVPDGEDCGFAAFMSSVDTLLKGRKTYEKVLSFGEWPYGDTPVVVLSRNSIAFPAKIPDTVTHSSEPHILVTPMSW